MVNPTEFRGPKLFGQVNAPTKGAKDGILVLPTIFGVNAFAGGCAVRLAQAGYACVVWDIQRGLPISSEYAECIRRARTLTDELVSEQIRDWTGWMLEELGVESIKLLGFCIGGRFALLAAAEDSRVDACVAAYPSIENPRLDNQSQDALSRARDIACPVQILQPGRDHVTSKETYAGLQQELVARTAPTYWQFYPDAEHGFMHREQPIENVKAARLAWPSVMSFLETSKR